MSSSEQPNDAGASAPAPAVPVQLTATVLITPASQDATIVPMADLENSPPKEPAPETETGTEAVAPRQSASESPNAAILQLDPEPTNPVSSTIPVVVEPSESMEITNPLEAVQIVASQLATATSDVLPSVLSIAKQNDSSVIVEDLDVVTSEITVTKPSENVPSSGPATGNDTIDPVTAPPPSPSGPQTTGLSDAGPPDIVSEPTQAPKIDPVKSAPFEFRGIDSQAQTFGLGNASNPVPDGPALKTSTVDVELISTTVVAAGEDSEMKDVEEPDRDRQLEPLNEKELAEDSRDTSNPVFSVNLDAKDKAREEEEAGFENEWSFSFSNEDSRTQPHTDNVPDSRKQSEDNHRKQDSATDATVSPADAEPDVTKAPTDMSPNKGLEIVDDRVEDEKFDSRPKVQSNNEPNDTEPAKTDLDNNKDDLRKQATNENKVGETDTTNVDSPTNAGVTTVTGNLVEAMIVEKDSAFTGLKDANDGDVNMADADSSAPPADKGGKELDSNVTKDVSEMAPADDDEIIPVGEAGVVSTPPAKGTAGDDAARSAAVTGTNVVNELGVKSRADSTEGSGSVQASAKRALRTSAAARMTRSGRPLGNGSVRPSAPNKDAPDANVKSGILKSGGTPVRVTRASTAGASGAPSTVPQAEIGSAAKSRAASVKASRIAGADHSGENMSVEARLRRELQAADALIRGQAEQIEELTRSLQEERINVSDMTDSHRAEINYSQQLSRLVRVFRELNVSLPPLTEPDWNARSVAQAVRNSIKTQLADSGEWTPAAEQRAFDLLRILLGAKVIQPGEDGANTIKLAMKNEDLQREISFWLFWNDANVRYTRIHMDVPEIAAPEFASEVSIDFDVRQGPHFLFQLLSSLFHQS